MGRCNNKGEINWNGEEEASEGILVYRCTGKKKDAIDIF
jgi:hypothetical protein